MKHLGVWMKITQTCKIINLNLSHELEKMLKKYNIIIPNI